MHLTVRESVMQQIAAAEYCFRRVNTAFPNQPTNHVYRAATTGENKQCVAHGGSPIDNRVEALIDVLFVVFHEIDVGTSPPPPTLPLGPMQAVQKRDCEGAWQRRLYGTPTARTIGANECNR